MSLLSLTLLSAALAAPLDCASLATSVAAAPDLAGRGAVIGAAVGSVAGDPDASAALGRMLSALPQTEGQSADSARALLFGACVGALPAPAPVATPAPAGPNIELMRQYERDHLLRGNLQSVGATTTVVPVGSATYATTNLYTVNTWTVYDGGGQPFTALTFSDRVGDRGTQGQVQSKIKGFRTAGWLASAAGVVLTGVGLNALSQDGGAGQGVGALLAGSAGIGVGVGLLVSVPAIKAAPVSRYYSPTQADTYIDAYNAELRKKLRLTAQDTADIDLR